MASYNKVLLMGNLTRDPELTYTPAQVAICKFSIAVSRKFKSKTGEDREKTTFVDCTAFDKRGEVINQYFTKGKPIFVEGTLELDQWDDKNTGQKRSKHYILVEGFQFVGGREGGGQGGGGGGGGDYDHAGGGGGGGGPPARSAPRPQGRPAPQQQRPAPQEAPFSDEQHFKNDDDIPF